MRQRHQRRVFSNARERGLNPGAVDCKSHNSTFLLCSNFGVAGAPHLAPLGLIEFTLSPKHRSKGCNNWNKNTIMTGDRSRRITAGK